MKLAINHLPFVLPETPFHGYAKEMISCSGQLKKLGEKAGTGTRKFDNAVSRIRSAIQDGEDLTDFLLKPIDVRALGVLLQSDLQEDIFLNGAVFERINELKPNPSHLFIQNLYQHYLFWYDQLDNPISVAQWLKGAMQYKGLLKGYHEYILSDNGPIWIANQCIKNKREFNNGLYAWELENYASGRFLKVAKQIYFVEQLKKIPVNQDHPLLLELQNKRTFDARYDEHYLLGHKILQILIGRAPKSGIDDSWLNVIMAIAGDPRVPTTHPKFQKWWQIIDPSLNQKVRGWLSRFDLRLFLEALENYSFGFGRGDLKRMFPSRKCFLEGLLNKGLITETRLYLSSGAARYLQNNYKREHLPHFSRVTTGDRSIIHVQMGDSHLIEGSHSCYLWIYPRLDSSAIVFNPNQTNVSYSSLTQGLSDKMAIKGTPSRANITHNPASFSWQRKAIEYLKSIRINISAKDVLSQADYQAYIRRYGVS